MTTVIVNYDVVVQSITASNSSAVALTTGPTVCYGNNLIIQAEIRNNTAIEDLSDLDSWRYGINQLGQTTAPLVESTGADFDVSNKDIGKLNISVNTSSSTLNTDLGTASGKRYYSEISGISNTTGFLVTVAVFPINILNTIYKDV